MEAMIIAQWVYPHEIVTRLVDESTGELVGKYRDKHSSLLNIRHKAESLRDTAQHVGMDRGYKRFYEYVRWYLQ